MWSADLRMTCVLEPRIERIHADHAAGQRCRLGDDLESTVGETRNVLIRCVVVKIRRDHLAFHRHEHLGDGAEAGRRLRVTHVRLDGSDQQRTLAVRAEHLADGVRLLRVADFGAGAVRLHVVDAVRVDASLVVHLFEELSLTFSDGR